MKYVFFSLMLFVLAACSSDRCKNSTDPACGAVATTSNTTTTTRTNPYAQTGGYYDDYSSSTDSGYSDGAPDWYDPNNPSSYGWYGDQGGYPGGYPGY